MSTIHAPDARFFVMQAFCSSDYQEYEDTLVELTESNLKCLQFRYGHLDARKKLDRYAYAALYHDAAQFIKLDWGSVPNLAGLEDYWQISGKKDIVEIPCLTYEMLKSRAAAFLAGSVQIHVNEQGFYWKCYPKHESHNYETALMEWKELWPSSKPKKKKPTTSSRRRLSKG